MDNLQNLKKKISQEENKRTKLMWQYANGFWKFIIVLGFLALMYISYRFGQYLVS